MANKYLVLLDTDKIHDYIFATNKLKEIRGASAILDELNLDTTYQELAYNFGPGNYEKSGGKWKCNNKTIAGNGIKWEVMFLGGGSGKILFKNGNDAKNFCQKLKEIYWKKTDGTASITAVVVPDISGEDFRHWIYRGEKELRKQKDSKYRKYQPLTCHYFKFCESNGLAVAEVFDEKATPRYISNSCLIKRQQEEKENVFFNHFKKFLENTDTDIEKKWNKAKKSTNDFLPKDLNAIGAFSDGYLGLIYADGNRMGQRLAELSSPEDYRNFSKKVQEGTEKAIFEALSCHLSMEMRKDQKCFPFEILLLGGDDLIAVVPANKAIEIARDFCHKFKDKTQVSTCAGVLITHANYPIHQMIQHAEELLKSAKRLSNKHYQENHEKEVNAIDFMVLAGALLQELKDMREKELAYYSDELAARETIRLYQRPYTTEDLNKLTWWIKRFKAIDFPRNKLATMYKALYRGKGQAMLDYCLILTRLEDGNNKPRQVIQGFWQGANGWDLDYFPWKKEDGHWVTPFIDLIELYDFIEEKREKRP